MSKKNLMIALLMLIIGVFFGVTGYALATAAPSPVTMFSNLWKGDPLESGQPDQTGQLAALDSTQDSDALADPDKTSADATADTSTDSRTDTEALKDEIISDYKLNVGTFFTAWKAKNMEAFREKLSEAYTGEILAKHAQQAERFINQGVGLNILDITFDSVEVISADDNAATLKAGYHYLAQDYMLGEEQPIGEIYQHEVKIKANMVKIGSHWFITGETVIEQND